MINSHKKVDSTKEQGVETAEEVIGQLKKYPVELVDADQELTCEAAKLKGRYKIAYAGCFAAALSHKLNAVIVTDDPEFKKLGGKYSIQWLGTK